MESTNSGEESKVLLQFLKSDLFLFAALVTGTKPDSHSHAIWDKNLVSC